MGVGALGCCKSARVTCTQDSCLGGSCWNYAAAVELWTQWAAVESMGPRVQPAAVEEAVSVSAGVGLSLSTSPNIC